MPGLTSRMFASHPAGIAIALLLWIPVAGASARGAENSDAGLAAKFSRSPDAGPLLAQFPLLASILGSDEIWRTEPATLKAQLFPPEVTLQQGSAAQPLIYSAQRSASWPGLPVWGQFAYEVEFYCFDPARPMIKLHLGRPLLNAFQQNRPETMAEGRRRAAEFPVLPDGARVDCQRHVEQLIAALRPYGAERLPFSHLKIAKYHLPGGTRMTVSDFSGSLAGSVYIEITLEPDAPLRALAQVRLPAFPGAEGYGAFTSGGRGGRVYYVTTLEDYLPRDRPGRAEGTLGQASVPPPGYDPAKWEPWIDPLGAKHEREMRPRLPGYPALSKERPIPGSLRAALEAEGPRTILFAVSGTIALKAPLVIARPYVTLVGNTAPGDGVQIRNWGIQVQTHDVILRFLRVRVGDIKGPGDLRRVVGDQTHALDVTGMNVIVDHCEFGFANDQIVNFYGHDDRRVGVSFQWNYVYGGLRHSTHEKGVHSMTYAMDGWGYASVHHNLTAHSAVRNPRIWGLHVDYRNNVLYDYVGSGYGNAADYVKLNYVGNVQRRGDWTWGFQSDGPFGEFYAADNRMPPGLAGDLKVPPEVLMPAPWESEPVTADSPENAYAAILRTGGASLPTRDTITTYVSESTRTNTGKIPDTTNDFPLGGFATYGAAAAAPDRDHDGIPDWWETEYGLNPDDPADAQRDLNGDGYTNLEKFLYGIDPTHKVDWRDPKQNVDPLFLHLKTS